jgi:hypothetical protein
MRSLWKSFSADQVDHADLQHIIQRHFRSGSQPGEREVIYPGRNRMPSSSGSQKTIGFRTLPQAQL